MKPPSCLLSCCVCGRASERIVATTVGYCLEHKGNEHALQDALLSTRAEVRRMRKALRDVRKMLKCRACSLNEFQKQHLSCATDAALKPKPRTRGKGR